jgi:hypothetical protein
VSPPLVLPSMVFCAHRDRCIVWRPPFILSSNTPANPRLDIFDAMETPRPMALMWGFYVFYASCGGSSGAWNIMSLSMTYPSRPHTESTELFGTAR